MGLEINFNTPVEQTKTALLNSKDKAEELTEQIFDIDSQNESLSAKDWYEDATSELGVKNSLNDVYGKASETTLEDGEYKTTYTRKDGSYSVVTKPQTGFLFWKSPSKDNYTIKNYDKDGNLTDYTVNWKSNGGAYTTTRTVTYDTNGKPEEIIEAGSNPTTNGLNTTYARYTEILDDSSAIEVIYDDYCTDTKDYGHEYTVTVYDDITVGEDGSFEYGKELQKYSEYYK